MPHVVVIGAGTAGLTVSRQLSHISGYKITILEATSRIGGRIKSIEMGGVIVDLGASWMHETRFNPLFEEALKRNWKMKNTDELMKYYTNRGELPRKSGIEPIRNEIESVVAEYFHQEKPLLPEEPSLKEFVTKQVLPNIPLISAQQRKWAELVYRQVEHFIGLKWSEIPAADGGVQSPLGRDAFMLGGGYIQVIDWLVQGCNMDNISINLEEEVTKVSSGTETKGSEFIVTTKKAEYHADYIVNTIPLGVLKQLGPDSGLLGGIDIQKSLRTTKSAALGKVVVQFPSIKWDPLIDCFTVAHEETGELVSIVNPFAEEGHAVLLALTGPDLTQRLESDPKNAYNEIQWAFKAVCGEYLEPPVRVAVTDWTQNPYSMGSYSARAIGQSYDELVGPWIEGAGRFRFAGEHTTLDGNGCVHGAYQSGLREAEVIQHMELEPNIS